ncbi:MAG: hypothetical protein DUD39_05365 [Coriobacteriaceae bacterium]|nr:MAG: hypothetical protein DUD39_05365 [Coriobacteriaceae bacterium]
MSLKECKRREKRSWTSQRGIKERSRAKEGFLGKKFPLKLCLSGLQRGQLLRRCTGMHTPMVVHEIFNTGFSLTADTMMENTYLPSGRGLWPSGSWHTKAAEHEHMCVKRQIGHSYRTASLLLRHSKIEVYSMSSQLTHSRWTSPI